MPSAPPARRPCAVRPSRRGPADHGRGIRPGHGTNPPLERADCHQVAAPPAAKAATGWRRSPISSHSRTQNLCRPDGCTSSGRTKAPPARPLMAEQSGQPKSARTPVSAPQAETSLLVDDRGDALAGGADLSGELGGGTRGPGHRPSRACVRRTEVGTTKESATCGTRRSRPVRDGAGCRGSQVPLGCANRLVAGTGTGAQSGADAVAMARGPGHREAHMDQMRLANGCAVRLRVKIQRAWSISVGPWGDGGHGVPPSRSG